MLVVGARHRRHALPTLFILAALFALPSSALKFVQEYCEVPPHHVWVEPDAEVTIGAVLPVHKSGEGIYGCGAPSPDGVQVFEAMRWAVDVLNRRSGLITEDSEDGGEGSLIPGVKIGLKVYDSCGHSALAVEHLTSLFPVLRSGPKACDAMAKNATLTIGVVDMSQSSSRPEVSESLRDYLIPSIQLSLSTLVPPEKMSQVLLDAAKQLKWSHVTVLHEDEEYSISVAKQLTQAAATGGATCITNIHSLPRLANSIRSNRKELRPFRKAFRNAMSGLSQGSAVLVVTRNSDTAARFLQVMSEFPELLEQIQWLFSWIPPSTALSEMRNVFTDNVRLYSIAPYPDKVVQFEDYWSTLAQTARFANVDDRWFLEYYMAEKGCKVPGITDPMYQLLPDCGDRQFDNDPMEVLLRTSRAIPALTSIFTLATAFHKAWEIKCNGSSGICDDLRAMMRKEFVSQFLEPIEYIVTRDGGADEDQHSRIRAPRATEKLEGNKLALTMYGFDDARNVRFRQVMVIDSLEPRILDHSFVTIPSSCSGAGCRVCVRPRQSRIDDPIQRIDADLFDDFIDDEEDDADIVIPLLLPLHKQGLSYVECSSELNPEAVQSLEAALWTVDRINEDPGFLAGAKLGISVVDTCSSPLLATQRLTTYVTEHGGSLANLAVVSAATAEETLAASRILRPLNISVLSASDLTSHLSKEDGLGLNEHLMQVETSADSVFEAALEVFDDAGWRFVTVVSGDAPPYKRMREKFVKSAKQRGICVGNEIEVYGEDLDRGRMTKVVQRVMESKHQGANIVVFMTDDESTKVLLSEFGRFFEASAMQPGELIMVGLGDWARDMSLVRGLEKVALGSLVFREEHGEVADFSKYFKNLHPESNFRNPYISRMLEKEASDNSNHSDNPLANATIYQSTTTTIQAIVAFAAGVASLRLNLCQLDMGLCPAMIHNNHLHQMMGEQILNSFSPRLDHPGQTFKFKKGHGDTPIAVFNMRKMSDHSMKYLKVGSYNGHYIKLANMLTYNQAGEVALETIPSRCISNCYHCQYFSASHALIPSSKDLYVAVTLGIHEPTTNPLVCGQLKPTGGFQNFEALLWAIDTINADPNILPETDIGLLVFDTCGSREKAAMDVSNFLTGKKEFLPSPQEVVAFLSEGSQEEVKPIADVTMPLGMTTIAPSVVAPEFGNTKKYSHMLKMNVPSTVIISSMVDILRYFHWKYVSVVYTDGVNDHLTGTEAYEEFKKQAEAQGIKIAVTEKIGLTEDIPTTMDIIAHRLKIKQNAGARVVVLLLSATHTGHLMSAIKRLQHVGRSQVGDFVWLSYDTLAPFQMFPDQAATAISLKPHSGHIPVFEEYFTSLDIKNNTRNPWFREYWEQIFNCRGSSCSSVTPDTLKQFGFVQDPSVSNTVNGLFTIALGLDSLQKHLCPGRRGSCNAMKNQLLVREKLFEFAKKIRFTGLDGLPIKFDENNYVKRKLDVYNFRYIGEARAFLSVGVYDEVTGLSVNSSLTRGYDNHGKQVPLTEVRSVCNDTDTCSKRSESGAPLMPFMKIPANQEFVIGVMMPVHQPGDSFFTCSHVVEESSIQNLLALSYALQKVNQNTTVLPEIQLGALVFDHCGRRQKAEEQIFSFIASDGSLPYSEAGLRSRAMVAALTYDPQVADDLSPLFESVLIPQIATPTGLVPMVPSRQRRSPGPADEIPVNTEIKAVADMLQRFDWKYVTLLHGGSETDRSLFWNFVETAKERKICIAKSLVIKPDMPITELVSLFSEELDPNADSKVIVLLLDDPQSMENVLEAAKQSVLIREFVWVGMESEKDARSLAKILQGVDVDFFLVRPETYDVPGFREYYSSFNLNKHDPIPRQWFEEFWQHHFHCHLPQSSSPLNQQFPEPCTGVETLSSKPLSQDTFVYHTVSAVTAVAESLHDYLRRYCIHGDAATNLEDCGTDARQILWREMRKFMKGPPITCVDGDCGPLKMSMGYQLFKLKRAKIHQIYEQIGLWKNEQLSLKIEDVEFLTGVKTESTCKLNCRKCLDQLSLDPIEYSLPKPEFYANFKTLWGVTVSALSLLGVILVISCAAYFLISFQVTIGTTVLGYMILFGLLILYAVNFAFILAPTEGTCGVRRFGLGLAYAVIFAGMLVKVMNIWRMMGYRGNQYFGDTYHITSPAALLVVAVGLVIIQVVLSSAWLILIPPTTGIHGGEWRCHPATTFEDELIISLVYVMLILAITILFSVLTWGCKDNNNESRWIFTCCFFMALVWVAWTVVSTQVLHRYRDLTISCANLVCATVVMLCMYLRKVYIYNKLTRDQESKAKMKLSVPNMPAAVPNMYGTISRNTPNITPVTAYNSGARLVGLSGKILERAAPSRMALITSEDENTSESGSGSVQVQATDLYPLDMYDGGSQFQPSSLRLGGSSLVVDEDSNNQKRS